MEKYDLRSGIFRLKHNHPRLYWHPSCCLRVFSFPAFGHQSLLSRSTLAKIEAGIRHISVEELNAIKAVLGISYDEFFK
jgi:Helix-turn-helix.